MNGQGFAGVPYDKQGWAGTPGSEPKAKTPGESLVEEWDANDGSLMVTGVPSVTLLWQPISSSRLTIGLRIPITATPPTAN